MESSFHVQFTNSLQEPNYFYGTLNSVSGHAHKIHLFRVNFLILKSNILKDAISQLDHLRKKELSFKYADAITAH
jgi:hypothetical protein